MLAISGFVNRSKPFRAASEEDQLIELRGDVMRIAREEMSRQRDLQQEVNELTRALEMASRELATVTETIAARQQQLDDINRQLDQQAYTYRGQ